MADDLTTVVAAFADGRLSAEEFTEHFMVGRWFAIRSDDPGFIAVGPPGAGYVPIFSSLAELGDYAAAVPDRSAGGVDWLTTVGDDLLSLIPRGYGLVVDVASAHAVYLRADAIEAKPVLVVQPRTNGEEA
ncbi:MAG: SseB family protein [Acidimicrobiales bacterium]